MMSAIAAWALFAGGFALAIAAFQIGERVVEEIDIPLVRVARGEGRLTRAYIVILRHALRFGVPALLLFGGAGLGYLVSR